MDDQPDSNSGPEPMVIDPDNPAGAVKPTTTAAPSTLAQQIEDHMAKSPWAATDPNSNPFVAGFHEALNHLRVLLARL